MKRSEAREKLFHVVFQMEFHDNFSEIYPWLSEQEGLQGVQGQYALDAVKGILENQPEIDDIIAKNLTGWTMDRLPKVSVAILRLGVYELMFDDSIPDITSIDEAVKLAYDYCDEKDSVFINGLLNNLYEKKIK